MKEEPLTKGGNMFLKDNWDEVKEIYKKWWNKELEYPLIQVVSPKEGVKDLSILKKWLDISWWGFLKYKHCPAKCVEIFEEICKNIYFGGEAFPNLILNIGPGSLASYFTGYLNFDENTNTAWFENPLPWEEVLKLEFREDNEWWQYTKFIAKLSAERAKNKFIVANTDIGGIPDVLASFRGTQNLLVDFIEESDKVLCMLDKILLAWLKVYENLYNIIKSYQDGTSFWMGIWAPGRSCDLQSDISYMISPKMFEKFVAPHIATRAKWLDYSIYHLDGPGQIPHLDILLDISELDGIQWVPGAGNPQCDSERWLDMYRKILTRNKLLVLQSFEDNKNIPKLLEKLPNKGRVLITTWCSSEAEAKWLIREIRGLTEY